MEDQPTTRDRVQRRGPLPRSPAAASAAERIAVIVEAAERAAAGVIQDAEEQARRYLEETRRNADAQAEARARELTEITDALLARANEVKRQTDELMAALDRAKDQIEQRIGADPSAAPGQPEAEPARAAAPEVSYLRAVEAARAEPSAGSVPGIGSAGARLLATQMAVAGKGRGEIEERLRAEFGIDDAGSMLDTILGPRG